MDNGIDANNIDNKQKRNKELSIKYLMSRVMNRAIDTLRKEKPSSNAWPQCIIKE